MVIGIASNVLITYSCHYCHIHLYAEGETDDTSIYTATCLNTISVWVQLHNY